jgi:ribose transport system substrate-binding protein
VNAAVADFGIAIAAKNYPPEPWGAASQTPLLDAMVARGDLDYIVTAPTSAQEMIAPLQAALDAGIGIVTVDTYLGDGDYVNGPVTFPISYIGSDNVEGGRIVARAMAEALGGTGEVYIQNTNAETSSVADRSKGFREVIAEFPDMEVVDEQYSLDVESTAVQQTAAVLEAHPNLKGIFGVNVFSAQGAGTAVENAGLTGQIEVAAYDATVRAIELLNQGTVSMVLAQKPFDMGYMGISFAFADDSGVTSLPKLVHTGFQVITADNVNDPNVARFIYPGP